MNKEFLATFLLNLLNSHNSIRWVGITDGNGILIKERIQDGILPLLSREDNQDSAVNAIRRHQTRLKFEPKIGKLIYAFSKYEKVSRGLIPLSKNYYLLLTMDPSESNYHIIFMEKIIPLVESEKEKFN